MIQRRMTVARIPPVMTTVPAVIRPTPHPTLRGGDRGVRGSSGRHTGHRAGGPPGTFHTAGGGGGGPEGGRGLGGLTRGLTASGGRRGGGALTEGGIPLPLSTRFQRFLPFFSLNSLLPLFSPLLTSCLNNHPPRHGAQTQRRTASVHRGHRGHSPRHWAKHRHPSPPTPHPAPWTQVFSINPRSNLWDLLIASVSQLMN